MTHSGAPCAISGSEASCALPANTSSDIVTASGTPSPALTIAMPVTRPHAPMPSEMPVISRAPRANSGWRQGDVDGVIAPLSYGDGAPR